ncbi:MAG: SDR family oxidoreductase [Planctomycetes bacterium]|nr:SDR family oxidoreductase [Planctomycetota bacterium]
METPTPFAPGLFEGRTCVVTGGGTGIGLATARGLVTLGARVALLGRRLEVVERAARTLDPEGGRALALRCDTREPPSCEEAVLRVRETLGPIRVLVNNAGGQFPSSAEALSPRGFEAVVRNNLLGTWNMTREVATRSMIPDGGGAIVNVTANVERGFPGMVHTGSARAGVENMTRTLAVEWVRHRIRVNAVAPGSIRTEGLAQYPEAGIEFVRRATPMKRLGTPEEVAWALIFLCSDAASFITGATLAVDGAQRLWGETWPIPDPDPQGPPA